MIIYPFQKLVNGNKMMRPGQTPLNKTPSIRGKEWTKIKDSSSSQKNKTQSESWRGKGTNHAQSAH